MLHDSILTPDTWSNDKATPHSCLGFKTPDVSILSVEPEQKFSMTFVMIKVELIEIEKHEIAKSSWNEKKIRWEFLFFFERSRKFQNSAAQSKILSHVT